VCAFFRAFSLFCVDSCLIKSNQCGTSFPEN
jgi:hypothetical protein